MIDITGAQLQQTVEALGARLGQQGRRWVLDHHQPELIAPKLIEVYERTLKGGG